MEEAGPLERARDDATGIVAILVTGTWLAAMAVGFEHWLALMLFGYVVVVPLAGILFEEANEERAEPDATAETAADGERAGTDGDGALETLRERYARGELTEEQFERKVERLLETETLEDVEDRRRARERLSERE